jgi:hypothetical protein
MASYPEIIAVVSPEDVLALLALDVHPSARKIVRR